jgi:hypothetical protein
VNTTVSYGPFFNVVDQLARSPQGTEAPVSDADIKTAIDKLTPDQKDALLSNDWGRIQKEIKAERAASSTSSASATASPQPDDGPWNLFSPWNLFQLEVRVEAIKKNPPAQ